MNPHPGSLSVLAQRLLITGVCLLPALAAGQQAPQAPQVTPRDLRPETPPRPPAALPAPAPQAVPGKAETLFVVVGDITLVGAFPDLTATTQALIAPLRGQRRSVADLYRLADEIENQYRAAGYALVRVVVPPQSLKDGGTLTFTLIDGFVERIDLAAVPERARRQVQATLAPLVGQRRLTSAALERALTLAGRGPGLSLRSALGAGQATGGTVLVLEGEHEPVVVSLSADDRSSAALGPWQSSVQVRLNQLGQRGEQLYFYVSGGADVARMFQTDARRRVGGGGVIVPLGDSGLSLNPEFTVSDTKPTPAPLAPLSRSQLERYTLRLIYPLILDRQQELTLTGTLDASRQTDSLPDFNYVLDIDALRVARLTVDWTRPLQAGRLRVSSTYSQGFTELGARTPVEIEATGIPMSRLGAKSSFKRLEMTASFDSGPLPWGLQARGVARAQWALEGVMPGAELFSLDGEDALSTFVAGAISDDGGWSLRQEVSRPMGGDIGGAALGLSPYAFAAGGRVTTRIEGAATRGLAASYGLGLRTQWRGASLSVEYGRRRIAGVNEDRAFLKGQVQF
ncbi:hypothetical protein CDN99_01350 [Roseateles aquatilis]|uniref:POTRA domain-containing protein n=1 Tax=Roseateles aquatilis TaxID=431061 RepID=A0A246JKJ4_9BURK|nr:ShlB/FhaC/HecB family hemolysin secretion/activation protein [Roseateles aquatilis]OWQ93174.1 hypothetical protein CDN99_01350 [Roseateles aquatilis]